MTRSITALGLLLFTFCAGSTACRAEEPTAALERLGARNGNYALYLRPYQTAEAEKYQKENPWSYVIIGTDWKGGVEGLKYLKALPGLRGVMFSHPDFSDEWVVCLRDLPGLKELYLGGERFTDAGAAELKNLTELEALSLIDTKVTDKGMVYLKAMTRLQFLGLCGCFSVTDKGFAHVPVKELRKLNLGSTEVSGESMARLKDATNLEWLRESGRPFIGSEPTSSSRFREVDAGLKHLKGLKNLNYVGIYDMPATEAEMKDLLAQCLDLPYVECADFIYTREGPKERNLAEVVEKALKRVAEQRRKAEMK